MEIPQPLVGEAMQIAFGHYLLERSLSPVRFGVFGTCQPAQQVGRTVVEDIRNQVMTDTNMCFAGFRIGEGGTVTIESERHKDMASIYAFA